jgi:hypothetical protein
VATYLAPERIAEAIEQIGHSKAKGGLLDFLVVKRTFALKGEPSVAITQSEPTYITALEELAGCGKVNGREVNPQSPYLNVFAITDKREGYRSAKYKSNGTNSTISNNPWQPVIELSSDDPRKASLRSGYEDHLETLLLKTSAREAPPKVDEVAIWYHRAQDIEALLSGASSDEERARRLRDHFVDELDLTAGEIAHLFDPTPGQLSSSSVAAAPADPRAYLPSASIGAETVPVDVTGVCSLDLAVALAAKPFVILTGPSGTGKSRAALKLAEGIQNTFGDKIKGSVFQLVPIGPDWTSPKRLLGFRTPFGELRTRADGSQTNDSYEITETLRLILRASHPDATGIPHFLIFDEMNLSHVERYFAPFLSLMEAANILDEDDGAPLVDPQSLATISEVLLHEDATSPEAEAAQLLVANNRTLQLPSNLFFIGTVNVDETTYMFSPKVLDRAHVIEIESEKPSLYLTGSGVQEPGGVIDLVRAGELLRAGIDDREGQRFEMSNSAEILDRLATEAAVDAADVETIRGGVIRALDGCYELLSPVGFPFGYRTAKEVFSYVYVWVKSRLLVEADRGAVIASWPEAVDKAVLQKVLPKIHGNKRVLGDSLAAVAAFCGGGHVESEPAARYTLGPGLTISVKPADALALPGGKQFGISKAKLEAMHGRLSATGYVSFVS